MPITPLHFAPAACLALPLGRRVDLPVFLLANVAIDLEPILVVLLDLRYPLHGLAHSLIGATVVGLLWGLLGYRLRGVWGALMARLRLPYEATLRKALLSAMAGCWLHVLLDSSVYYDIRPLYPSAFNPLLGWSDAQSLSLLCLALFVPAVALYGWMVRKGRGQPSRRQR